MVAIVADHPFLRKHQSQIQGVLSCFDRVIFRGYLPFCHARALEGFLNHHNVLLKDFKAFAMEKTERLKEHAQALAKAANRPYQHLAKRERKEELARRIAERDGVRSGLIVVFGCLETCRTFRLQYGQGRPSLKNDYRRCLVLYFYYLDDDFGLVHLKLETWFPFTCQVYVNGHEWLARQLTQKGIGHVPAGNTFVQLSDARAAQALADRFVKINWPKRLTQWAHVIHPLFADLLKGLSYYWVVDQAEYATDVLFTTAAALASCYPRFVEHATLRLGTEDVLRFLGRRPHASFQGEVQTHCCRRLEGVRVKHTLGANRLKMYDKEGVVLRIETVINDPTQFRVRRWRRTPDGQRELAWQPLRKGVGWLWRYAQVSQAANSRYLQALAVVDDPAPPAQLLARVTRPVTYRGRRRRALQPLSPQDLELFRAVLRGEHGLRGFRNQDVARQLFGDPPRDSVQRRRQSAQVTRWIGLLRAHGLATKVPRARRYHLTHTGFRLLSMTLYVAHSVLPTALQAAA
jgi:hypothetical protein